MHPDRRISSRAISVVAAAALLATASVAADADTADDLDSAKQRLTAITDEIAARDAAVASLQEQLNDLAGRIEVATTELEQTREEMAEVQAEIEDGEAAYEKLRARLSDRAAEAFMQGSASGLEVLMAATSMSELSDRLEFIDAVARKDTDLANAVHNKLFELDGARAELERIGIEQEATLNGLEQDQTDLEDAFAAQQTALGEARSLRSEAEDLVSSLGEKLQRELQPPPPPPAPPSASGDGKPGPLYACPVDGPHAYADTFGETHVHPGWTHIHEGNDIAAPYGTPIVAPFNGSAVSSSDDRAGLYVTVSGSEGFVQMLHMSSFAKLGSVRTGDVVGYIGTTGNASSPHTHFEWHPGGGAAVDPYPQLNEVC